MSEYFVINLIAASSKNSKNRSGDTGLFHCPIIETNSGSVGVGLCKYASILTNNLSAKPTLITRILE
jgi:hypothetical protein